MQERVLENSQTAVWGESIGSTITVGSSARPVYLSTNIGTATNYPLTWHYDSSIDLDNENSYGLNKSDHLWETYLEFAKPARRNSNPVIIL